ncbi:MAG: hypothetical protein AAB074_16490 [Planctomycetota bacterium]
MKSSAALLLLPFALMTLTGCSDPVDESAVNTYKVFAGNIHSGNFQAARDMLEHKAPQGWSPRVGGPPAPTKKFRIKSVDIERNSWSARGDSITLSAEVTITYEDRRKALEVVFIWMFGGGEWFAPDEKLRWTHHATMRRVDGVWKISDVQIVPKQ